VKGFQTHLQLLERIERLLTQRKTIAGMPVA